MKILVFGAGVIGATYGWQLSKAGHAVTVFARKTQRARIENDGIRIRCKDERRKSSIPTELVFHPAVVDELTPKTFYDLIIVSVRAHQLDEILPLLADNSGESDILFFGNNWWGDEKIHHFLPAEKYLFGFSRLVGGWRKDHLVECIIFNNPELVTMLGEKDGQITPRLQNLRNIFEQADLKPVISPDIIGWLTIHYVEFLGVIGGILKAGSFPAFVSNSGLISESIFATRETLDVCKARGVDFKKAAPINIRIVAGAPVFLLVPLVQMQYRSPSIQQFFEENIANGMDEIRLQYRDVLAEGKRLDMKMPCLAAFQKYFS
jgi:ketopantoate reductase